ncbi:MAG: AAA family ATPase [Planctomycetaceae bacterium]|nr:AAA family ATPase [Planctomycetaceae bacterium]
MLPFLQSLKINNLLSFGPDSPAMEFGPLNVIIGPNGSGKSNLFDVLALLKNAPGKFDQPIIDSGCPLSEWFWKGEASNTTARIELNTSLRHIISFCGDDENRRITIIDEWIGPTSLVKDQLEERSPFFFYGRHGDEFSALRKMRIEPKEVAEARIKQQEQEIEEKGITKYIVVQSAGIGSLFPDENKEKYPNYSALSRFGGIEEFSALSYLSDLYQKIHLYNNWTSGRKSPLRFPQNAYHPDKWLNEDGSNFYIVLKKIKEDKESHSRYLEFLKQLYENVDDYEIVQLDHLISIRLIEGENRIPAARLSDGTLRYLMLLAVLCDPEPPPLICIEEPEMGLHPDLIMVMGDALKYAAERTQVIVTTHSVRLVDCFNDSPQVIQVCEKHDGSTIIERLDPEYLKPWLEKYRLGELWTSGEIGGNRW